MPDSHVSDERTHVSRAKHIPYQTAALVHVEGVALRSDNTSRILAPMLEDQQSVIKELVDWSICDQTQNSAHIATRRW